MTEPHTPSTVPAHAGHDPELIAALAVREPDLPVRELAAARSLVEACTECRDLLADLLALQTALPAALTPARPRDFTITGADAHRLRGAGWRRVLGFFGSPRDAFSRPLAIGFTTIGLAALLITALPSVPLGTGGATSLSTSGGPVTEQATAAEAPGAGQGAATAAPSIAASAAPAAVPAAKPSPASGPAEGFRESPAAAASDTAGRQGTSALPYATSPEDGGVFTGSNEGTGEIQGDAGDAAGDAGLLSVRDDGLSLGVVIAGICLIVGLGLFALRWSSRRFGDG